jgi:hypothetical protein
VDVEVGSFEIRINGKLSGYCCLFLLQWDLKEKEYEEEGGRIVGAGDIFTRSSAEGILLYLY